MADYPTLWTYQNDKGFQTRYAIGVEIWSYEVLTDSTPSPKQLVTAKRVMAQDGAPLSYAQRVLKLALANDSSITPSQTDAQVQSTVNLLMPILAANDL